MIKETILELINNDFINTGKIYFSNNIPIQISNAIYSFGSNDISNIIVSTWINLSSPQHRHLKFSTLFFKELVVPYVVERKKDPDNTRGARTHLLASLQKCFSQRQDFRSQSLFASIPPPLPVVFHKHTGCRRSHSSPPHVS